jgi:cobalt-zinc-cadmium resistance protein CzcA
VTESAPSRRAASLALVLVLAIVGTWIAARLPSSIFPEVTFPIVKVIADAGEVPAIGMIPAVTRPLEEAIRRVPGVVSVRSTTSRGGAELSVMFDWGTDMVAALQRVQAETEQIRPELPADTTIETEWMNPASFPILGYALTSDSKTQAQLLTLANYTLKPALLRVPGVSEVQIQGGRDREFQIWLDAAAMDGHGLTAGDVVDAVRSQNQVLSAGLVEQNHELYLALVDGRVDSVDALGRIAIPVEKGPPVPLTALGQVQVADEVSYIRTTANGEPAVLINVLRQPAANTVAIADGIDELFANRDALVPSDVQWSTFYDQASFVRASVAGTRDAIAIGVALAGLVLLVFLRRLQPTVVAVVVIPVTVAIACIPLGAAGQTANLMTLAGVAASIGLIADDAIVVIEHLDHHRGAGSVRTLLPALVGSSLATTVILLPFSLLTGVVGAFFRPLALTMALMLTGSFFLAWAIVPIAMSRSQRSGTPPESPEEPVQRGRYARFVEFLVRHPSIAVLVTAVLVASSALLLVPIGTDFLPEMDEGSIVLDYWTPPGTSLSETDAMLRDAEQAFRTLPDIAGYSRRTGAQLGFFVTEPNTGDYVINLKPRSERRAIDEVIDDIRRRIEAVQPAVEVDFGQLIEDEIGDLTGGEPQPIDLRIFGGDEQVLQARARQIASILEHVEGVEDVFDGITISGPALRIAVDPIRAARAGLDTEAVHAAVEPFLTGTLLDPIRVGDRQYDLRVLARKDGGLDTLRLRAPASGESIPLSDVAEIATTVPEAEINREDLDTFVGVTARLSGRDLGGAVREIKQTLARELPLAPGQTIRYGGLYEQQQQSFRGLLLVLLAGLVLVGNIVMFEFGDWRAPVLVIVCALAVPSGVLLALLATGTTLNISSFVGAIMMVGIVGENAIFVIHDAQSRLRAGQPVPDAWVSASRRRLRPVAMTVLATAFALAPLALGIGAGSQLVQPLAIAVIGGFVLSGPIVLLLLPALYAAIDPKGRLAGP